MVSSGLERRYVCGLSSKLQHVTAMQFANKIQRYEVKLLLAATIGLAIAWVVEPTLLAAKWEWRLGLAAGCLATTGIIFRLDARRQSGGEKIALRYIDMLCRLDPHDLADAELHGTLPTLPENNHWHPIFSRTRECLVEYGKRADEAEHAWTSAEVRLRRVASDYARLDEFANGLPDAAMATNQYGEIVWANQAARELFALELEDGKPAAASEQLNDSALIDLLTETLKRQNATHRTGEFEVRAASGDSCWYRVSCRALLGEAEDGSSDVSGAVIVLTDTQAV